MIKIDNFVSFFSATDGIFVKTLIISLINKLTNYGNLV